MYLFNEETILIFHLYIAIVYVTYGCYKLVMYY